MYIVENFRTRPNNKADGQSALFLSEKHAFGFFTEQVCNRVSDFTKIKNFNKNEYSKSHVCVSIDYSDGTNEVLCVHEIKFFDE